MFGYASQLYNLDESPGIVTQEELIFHESSRISKAVIGSMDFQTTKKTQLGSYIERMS